MKTLLVVLLLSSHAFAEETVKQEFDPTGLESVEVENLFGQVHVRTLNQGKVVVLAKKQKFSDKCQLEIKRKDNELEVEVEKKGLLPVNDCQVDFDIQVPKTVKLEISNGSGDIKVSGIHGELDYKVGRGTLQADGEFTKVEGKTGFGDVTIKGLLGGGEVEVGSGKIQLTFTEAKLSGEIEIKTGAGDATLEFPKGTAVKTRLLSGTGRLQDELGEDPKASFKVSMKTGSGNLKIKPF